MSHGGLAIPGTRAHPRTHTAAQTQTQ
jgi:hypothetical protein